MKKFIKGKKKLTLFFVLLNLTINFISMLILWIIGMLLIRTGLIHYEANTRGNRIFAIVVLSLSQLISCGIVAIFISRHSLKPINKTIDALNELAKGNFSQRLNMTKTKVSSDFSDSFNRLAEELENTEMLRSDFVNNFSHEFKTPIVSILGFSRLMKKGVCTPEEQKEYLNIIEAESLRLSKMATNVLTMTKVENTAILTNVTRFNLSEQIRNCLLLLEKSWSEKEPELNIDLSEFEINANEELLKEVWINLLDNAVKFVPYKGELSISAEQDERRTIVRIGNTGEKIAAGDIDRIFGKFYQGDRSHSEKGTGLGLSIVKKITSLHGGTVSVTSDDHRTVFTVELPN